MKPDKEKNNDGLSRSRRINIKVEKEREQNPYYQKVSKRYRSLKLLTLGVLVLYLLGSLIVHRSQITYENLVYLMKDLNTDIDAEGAEFKEIKYDESSKLSAAIFKGYFAAATTTSLTLYNNAAVAERSYPISMENPKVLAGDKYVMVYDVGGTSYSLYTSIVDVLTKQTEYTLQGAAMADSGAFALISRARENRYVVEFYDENFKEISKIYKDKYVMDAALSSDGKRYAVVSCEVSGTDISTEVMSGMCDSESASNVTLNGSMALDVGFFSNGSFCVICDNKIAFFSASGELVTQHSYNGYGLFAEAVSGGGVMTVEGDNLVESRSTATVYDYQGNVVLTHSEDAKIAVCALSDGVAYLAFDGVLVEIGSDGTARRGACPTNVSLLLPYGHGVLVCTPGSAATGFTEQQASAETDDAGN